MIKPIRLAHIVFRTNDIEAMKSWYSTVLSAHVVFGNDHIVFLTYDEEHHRIALISGDHFSEKSEEQSVGFYHAAFTYEKLSDLLDTYERLKQEGITPWRTINHGPTISFYYADPDANAIELQVDRFADALEAQEWMQGAAFESDPIGVLVDPADLRHRMDTGESFESLMMRPDERS